MYNVVLLMPEHPGNVGNIARTCVLTESRLHLVRPVSYTHLTLPTIAAECRSRWSPYH